MKLEKCSEAANFIPKIAASNFGGHFYRVHNGLNNLEQNANMLSVEVIEAERNSNCNSKLYKVSPEY